MMVLTVIVIIAMVATRGTQAFFNLGGGGTQSVCVSFCASCSGGTCSRCEAGYFLSSTWLGDSCSPCGPYCSHCASASTCQTCKSGYVKEPSTGYCMWNPNHVCQTNCVRCSSRDTCDQCKGGFTYNAELGICTKDLNFCSIDQCAHCGVFVYCNSCNPGHALTAFGPGVCTPCHDSGCLVCQRPDVCLHCRDGYTLTDGTCVEDVAVVCMEHCESCTTADTCDQCEDQYSFLGGECKPDCIDDCVLCNEPNTCQQCMNGYEYNSDNNECVEVVCMEHCLYCASSTTCDQCEDHYSYIGGMCKPNCIDDCVLCGEPNTCQQCMNGYEYNSDNNECIEVVCMDHCDYCGSSITCDQCEDQYSYREGQCQPDCVDNCVYCDEPGSCEQCADGYRYNADDAECVERPAVPFRLRQGALVDTHVGLVEILLDDVWHPVCAQGWAEEDGNVLCGSLGYANTGSLIDRVLVTDEELSPYYSRFRCTGTEATLLDCEHKVGEELNVEKCNSSANFAWVSCVSS